MSLSIRKQRANLVLKELKNLHSDAKMILNFSNHWELLVAVVLSAQCTDKKVNEVTSALFQKYKTLDDYIHANPSEFEQDIKSTGYFRSKTKHILAAAKELKERFNEKMPDTIEELITLPGVGRKTANVILGNAYQKAEGIAVDTHVSRLAQKFKLTKYTDPKQIERDLMQLIDQEEWFTFTYMMIEYGRQYSPARKKHDSSDPITQKLIANELL